MKLKVLILLTLALLAFSTPILVTLNVATPKFHGVVYDIAKNDSSVQPCGDPIDDPDFPH